MHRLSWLFALLLAACATRLAGSPKGALASPEPYAAFAGAQVLRDGGNAADAAACMGFVLAVTHPPAGNLGGGGFILVHTASKDEVIDARERAPRAARRDMFLDKLGHPVPGASLVGPRAAGVPGSVAGYLMLQERFGKLGRKRILAPAIRLAEEGFRVDAKLHASFVRKRELLARFPETARVFLPGGEVVAKGEKLRQPELAKVLRAIAEKGADGFYRGWFAEKVQKTCAKHGARLTIGDLVTYRAKVRPPLRREFSDGLEVVTMPPPSSGGVVLLQMLEMLEMGHYAEMREEQRIHLFAEVGRRAFADRAVYFGDPDFVSVPLKRLLSEDYLRSRFETIRMDRATPSSEVAGGLAPPSESEETCHFSVVDRQGNAVSCTTTLNGAFGCGLAVSGVLLNNEMDDFTSKPGSPNQFGLVQGEKNAIAPGKRPLSSMTPTILLRKGKPVMVLGSPGGPTIISTVCQVIANRIDLGMDPLAAVAAPRVHHQWLPDEIVYESLSPATIKVLEALGHHLRRRERPLGDVQAVMRTRSGRMIGVSDPRGRGLSLP